MRICEKALSAGCREDGSFFVRTNAAELRLWFLTDDILRVRAGFDEGADTGEAAWDEASYALTMTAWDSRTDALMRDYRRRVAPAEAAFSEDAERFVLQGRRLRVEVEREPFRLLVFDADGTLLHADTPRLSFREDSNRRRLHTSAFCPGDHFYGFGEKTGRLNKAGQRLVMSPEDAFAYDPAETDDLYKHIPFYIRLREKTHTAVGYFYDCPGVCEFDMGKTRSNYWGNCTTFCADSGDVDLFLIAGPSVREVLMRYAMLTGTSAMLPKQALGYLASSMYYVELPRDCDKGILSFLDTAAREGIPVDGFQMSSGYCNIATAEGLKRCTFTWNPARFENPAAWLAEMKRRGVPVTANIKPGMLHAHPRFSEMKAQGVFVRASDDAEGEDGYAVGSWWGGKGLFFDFTDEKARAYWKAQMTEQLLNLGCTSIWNDNCEYDGIADLDSRVSFEGRGGTVGALKGAMASLMAHVAVEAVEAHDENERPYILNRSGYAGIQRYAQTWAGDNQTSWETLRWNIATMLGMSLSGVANQGCDVGGFAGDAPGSELLLRWVQNGIFMPRFSIHSTNPDNTVTEPWMYSDVKELIRGAIRFRYRLMPYLYALEARAHETGLPIMAPLLMGFQHDSRTWEEDTAFLLGDGLLVAGVVEEGAKTRRIYLPEEENGSAGACWYDFYTRAPYAGGQEIEIPVTLASIPLYIRSGAIIPLADNRIENLARDAVTDLRLLVAPGDDEASFALYEDDGVSNDYRNGGFLRTEVTVRPGARTTIAFVSEGNYPTAVERVTLDVIHRARAPLAVVICPMPAADGTAERRELPRFLNREAFEAAEEGWYYSMRLRSVLIRYANPKRDYTAEISFEERDIIGM